MAKSKGMTFGHDCAVKMNGNVVTAVSEDFSSKPEFNEPGAAMIASRHPQLGRLTVMKKDISGTLTFHPSYAEYEKLLDCFFDGSSSTWTPADDTNGKQFTIVIDRDNSKIFTYAASTCNTFRISCSENNPVQVEMECLGTTEASSGAVAAVTQASPMIMSDSTLSFSSDDDGTFSEYFAKGFTIECTENKAERFHNSITRSSTAGGTFECKGSVDLDLNSDNWTDLYSKLNSATDVQFKVVLTDGATTFTHTMTEVALTSPTPSIGSDGEVDYSLEYKAYKPSSGDEISIAKT
jgi:hypothetical protein